MSRGATQIVCRASWRDPISVNFLQVSFSTVSCVCGQWNGTKFEPCKMRRTPGFWAESEESPQPRVVASAKASLLRLAAFRCGGPNLLLGELF